MDRLDPAPHAADRRDEAVLRCLPRSAHPMAILSSATNAISTFYEQYYNPSDPEAVAESAKRLIAKMPTIAAWAYKKSIGQPYMYPRNDLDYVENFLHMMFALPVEADGDRSRSSPRRSTCC